MMVKLYCCSGMGSVNTPPLIRCEETVNERYSVWDRAAKERRGGAAGWVAQMVHCMSTTVFGATRSTASHERPKLTLIPDVPRYVCDGYQAHLVES